MTDDEDTNPKADKKPRRRKAIPFARGVVEVLTFAGFAMISVASTALLRGADGVGTVAAFTTGGICLLIAAVGFIPTSIKISDNEFTWDDIEEAEQRGAVGEALRIGDALKPSELEEVASVPGPVVVQGTYARLAVMERRWEQIARQLKQFNISVRTAGQRDRGYDAELVQGDHRVYVEVRLAVDKAALKEMFARTYILEHPLILAVEKYDVNLIRNLANVASNYIAQQERLSVVSMNLRSVALALRQHGFEGIDIPNNMDLH